MLLLHIHHPQQVWQGRRRLIPEVELNLIDPHFREQMPANPIDLGWSEGFAVFVGAEVPEPLLQFPRLDSKTKMPRWGCRMMKSGCWRLEPIGTSYQIR
jgi:hypothetical protein